MELRHLEQFVAVAEERHFTRAADRCHIAQSALSTSIRALERELGAKLFVRTTRPVRLTEAGEALLPQARRTLEAAQQARDAVSHAQGQVRGSVVIGHSRGPIGSWLGDYHRLHPKVNIVLEQAAAPALIDGVRNGRLDVALASVPPSHDPPGVTVVRREEVPLGIVCGQEHRLARRASAAIGNLRHERFVMVTSSHPAAPVADKFWAAADGHCSAEAADAASALELVARGFGIALMPRGWTETRRDLHWVKLTRPKPVVAFGVVISDRAPSMAVQALLEQLHGASHLVEP